MFAVVTSDTTHLRPGAVVQFPGSWEEYSTLASRRGDGTTPRIKYRQGEILLMSPLPQHGRSASLVADIVKAILDFLGQNYEAFTPITIELPQVGGIEPDFCFYIKNWQAAVGKDRIDWTIAPPPDLAIEIDVTNYTNIEDYLIYRIPEVWLLRSDFLQDSSASRLQIYLLTEDQYITSERSLFFPNLDITAIIADCSSAASTQGSGAAMQQLRERLKRYHATSEEPSARCL
ncbi:MAG: Uma2 family endonuclease [Cyanophyceae cyanobacterium]